MKDGWSKKRAAIFVCRYVIPPVAVVFLMVVGPLRGYGSFDLHCFEWAIRVVLAFLVVATSRGTGNVLAGANDPARVVERERRSTGKPYIRPPSRTFWLLNTLLQLFGYYVLATFWLTLAALFGLPDLGLFWSVLVGFLGASLSVAVIGWSYFKLYRFFYEDD